MNYYGPIDRCPRDGQGRRRWSWKTACLLRDRGLSVEAVAACILVEMRRTGPENHADVTRTVENAFMRQASVPGPLARSSIKIQAQIFEPNPAAVHRFYVDGGNGVHPSSQLEFIRVMLGDAPAVCFGDAPYRTTTVCTAALHEGLLRKATLLVPNPMTGITGLNKEGSPSSRCESLIVQKKYQLIEYDGLDFSSQIIRLQYLRSFGVPLVATVFSGRESLHAWFLVQRMSPADQAAFFDYAVHATGADPAHRSPVQLTRLPFATRPDTGALQRLVFFKSPSLS